MQDQLVGLLRQLFSDAQAVSVGEVTAIPGGFSRETYRFDAKVRRGGVEHDMPMILRKDPPAAAAILVTSRQVEHELIEAVRAHTNVPVSESYGYELDASVFGEAAMVIQRMGGNGHTSDLFHDGPDADQADNVMRHLCELLVELHTTDIDKLNVSGQLSDPRHVGIDTTSWDSYMDSTFEYYISSYPSVAYDPTAMIILDAACVVEA
jgi:aminoglycoside phosphotransferase (APT) family kinase protein